MMFRHSRKRGDLSTVARIRIEIIHLLKVLLVAVALSIVILLWLVALWMNAAVPPPMVVSAYEGTYAAGTVNHVDLCTAPRYNLLHCDQATATAVAKPHSLDLDMCCVH